jgi:NAD(P)-dependent dehydrogenase (short-subunit alcohol dehydrogenase family)
MTNSHELHGKGAVVVGGAGAIGRALAAGLLEVGMNVVLVDASEGTKSVADELAAAASVEVLGLQADVSDEKEVDHVFAEAYRFLGNPYALIHAAGVYPRIALLDLEPSEWDRTLAANLRSFFLCTKLAVKMMRTGGEGRIVGLGSGLAVSARPRSAAYAASKAGLMAFVRAVAAELGDENLTINCISPGITESSMMRGANSDEEVAASIARSGRLPAQPSEILTPLLYLLGDDARYVSGTTLWMRLPR